jgi:hypothetical protein
LNKNRLPSGCALLLAAAESSPSKVPGGTIAERDVLLCIRSGAVRRFYIMETSAGQYRLRVSLTFEPHDFEVASARGMPREWASLDSLAKQIRNKFGSPCGIVLSLCAEATEIKRGDAGGTRGVPATARRSRPPSPHVLAKRTSSGDVTGGLVDREGLSSVITDGRLGVPS